jgi:hypothetical protein
LKTTVFKLNSVSSKVDKAVKKKKRKKIMQAGYERICEIEETIDFKFTQMPTKNHLHWNK